MNSKFEAIAAGARRGLMFVLSSPSGAGKTTLSRSLMDGDHDIALSISATTRQRRPSEADGVHYHFVSEREFKRMRDDDELLEWAEVHGHLYGTPREPVEAALSIGRDVMFDIDWQGTQQMREKMTNDLVSIFILPPNGAELHRRLRRRAEDADEVIMQRLNTALEEIRHWVEYDHVLVNRDLDASLDALRAILFSERTKRRRQVAALDTFAETLIGELEHQISGLDFE